MASKVKSRTKHRNSNKQRVWKYIRRNPRFRVNDVMMILDVTQAYIKPILWHLELAGYIKLNEATFGAYTDRWYSLVKDTGLVAPSAVNGEVYDHNTGETIIIDDEHDDTHWKKEKLKMLGAMTGDKIIRSDVADGANMNAESAIFMRCWKCLRRRGVVKVGQRTPKKRFWNIDEEAKRGFIAELYKSV